MFGLIAALIGVFAVLIFLASKKRANKEPEFKVERKPLLTDFEKKMYARLKEAFPEPDFMLFVQVSMGALLQSEWKHRNKYGQKIVDFVLCGPSFFVLTVIELDDPSHRNKAVKDAERDAMLAGAGIRTLRFKKIPSKEELRNELFKKN